MQSNEPEDGISRRAFGPIQLIPGQGFILRRIRIVPKRAVRGIGERVFLIDVECGDFCDLGPCHEVYEADGSVIAVLRTALRVRSADGITIPLEPGIWSIYPAR